MRVKICKKRVPNWFLYYLCRRISKTDGASYEYYTDDGETKDYDKPEHFVQITLDADGNAKSDRATVKVEG